jgi:hypothetical protein
MLHPPGGADVLALHPDRDSALLQIARLVDDQRCPFLAKVVDRPVANVVADGVLIPDRSGEQVLHPIGRAVAGVLGDRPAVLAGQLRQQPAHKRPGPPA